MKPNIKTLQKYASSGEATYEGIDEHIEKLIEKLQQLNGIDNDVVTVTHRGKTKIYINRDEILGVTTNE